MRSGQRPADLLLAPPMDKVYFVLLLILSVTKFKHTRCPQKVPGTFGSEIALPDPQVN